MNKKKSKLCCWNTDEMLVRGYSNLDGWRLLIVLLIILGYEGTVFSRGEYKWCKVPSFLESW